MSSTALNYNPVAIIEDPSRPCIEPKRGCTIPSIQYTNVDTDTPGYRSNTYGSALRGVGLVPQTIYNGPATQWLKQEAETDLFLNATGKSLDAKKMRDRELINRFCSFYLLGYPEYTKADMDGFLARSLLEMNKMSAESLTELSEAFRLGLRNNYALFGAHAFRKHTPEQTSRNTFNASLWDVMITGLARFSEEKVAAKTKELKQAFYSLLSSSDFNAGITTSPNSVKRVEQRFTMANGMFKEVLE